MDEDTTLGAGCSSGLLSGSSGMVSFDNGLALLPELLVDSLVGDLMLREPVVLGAVAVGVRVFGGLIGVMREEVVDDGRLGAAEAAPPNVVRLVLSVLGSGFGVRETPAPTVDLLEGRLFSSPSPAATFSLLLPTGLRTDEVGGRVGGLLIVLPGARDDNALVLLIVGDAGVLLVVAGLEEAVVRFFESSVEGLAGGFAPVGVRLSMSSRPKFRHQSRVRNVQQCNSLQHQ